MNYFLHNMTLLSLIYSNFSLEKMYYVFVSADSYMPANFQYPLYFANITNNYFHNFPDNYIVDKFIFAV